MRPTHEGVPRSLLVHELNLPRKVISCCLVEFPKNSAVLVKGINSESSGLITKKNEHSDRTTCLKQ